MRAKEDLVVPTGSLVIQEERQKVEELKKRVQDEVRAQWQQQRNSNCQSFTSATSDDSSSNSADQARDRYYIKL
jgi:hypothetical protein